VAARGQLLVDLGDPVKKVVGDVAGSLAKQGLDDGVGH